MTLKRAAVLVCLAMMTASVVVAQDAERPWEFGRASSGPINAVTKAPTNALSGSIGMTMSGSNPGYAAALGGAVVADRLWFFGTFQAPPALSEHRLNETVAAELSAQRGDRTAFRPTQGDGVAPSSFLTLRYAATPSSNLMLSGSFLRGQTTPRE